MFPALVALAYSKLWAAEGLFVIRVELITEPAVSDEFGYTPERRLYRCFDRHGDYADVWQTAPGQYGHNSRVEFPGWYGEY